MERQIQMEVYHCPLLQSPLLATVSTLILLDQHLDIIPLIIYFFIFSLLVVTGWTGRTPAPTPNTATHTHIRTHTHSLSLSHTHTHIHSHTHTHTLSLTHTHTPTLSLSLSLSLSHTHTQSHTCTAPQRELTTKCWKSHVFMICVACFGRTPRLALRLFPNGSSSSKDSSADRLTLPGTDHKWKACLAMLLQGTASRRIHVTR